MFDRPKLDRQIEAVSKACTEAHEELIACLMNHYGERGAVLYGENTKDFVFVPYNKIKRDAEIYSHDQDVQFFCHLVSVYEIYTQAVLAVIGGETSRLMGLGLLTIDSIKL